MDLCQEGDSSGKGRTEISGYTVPQEHSDDRGYDSCDSEDMNTGFRRYKESNLADWLGMRLPWEGWTYEATCAMTSTAHKIDLLVAACPTQMGRRTQGPGEDTGGQAAGATGASGTR